MTIGDIIRNRRLELHMTQEEVAKATGTTKATVSRWESGEITRINLENAKSLSKVLSIDIALFMFTDEVLFPGEYTLISAYREADEGTRSAVRKLLDINYEK